MQLALSISLLVVSQYPDALDHLRSGDVVPQIGLLLDRSCSMGWGGGQTECSWYASQYTSGNQYLNKKNQMKSVLVGCRSEDDGILDRWESRVNFSIYEFGSGAWLKVPFDSDLAALEQGVMAIPSSGSTQMTRGLKEHGQYFSSYFTNANTEDCRPNFLVMLSDGNPNGGSSTFDFECSATPESRYVSSSQPWEGSDYLYQHDDLLCSVDGDQSIQTYTVGFGAAGDFSPSNLQNIANSGGGEYFYASDVDQLSEAFEQIVSTIVSKSALFYAPIAIQAGSLFSENFAYVASFKPQSSGPWRGSVKKHCVVPPVDVAGVYDTSSDECIFTSSDGDALETNPNAMDLWTGIRSTSADVGGAGEVLFTQLGAAAGGTPQAPYWSRRNILTWRPGQSGYVQVDPSTWSSSDSYTNGCEHNRLLNLLHGYTHDADCSNGAPVSVASWPLGDPIHAPPTLLKYGPCHDDDDTPIPGNCYLASAMNDGMLHLFDAASGEERSALIPGELWQPSELINSALNEIMDQPSVDYTHRYYLDGGTRLFHHDQNSDGYIQDTETAYLIFSLGRGGRVMYRLDIQELNNGALDSTKNAIAALQPTQGSAFEDLQNMWASPWLGRAKFDGTTYSVAAFGSGHIPDLDMEGTAATPPAPTPAVDTSAAATVNCNGSGHFADFNGLDQAHWCDSMYFSSCNGTGSKPCYDGGGTPLDVSTQPLGYNDGVSQTAALRVYFNKFDLQSGDELRVEDTQGNLVGSYTGSSLDKGWTDWVFDTHLVLRLITNGQDSSNKGYTISKAEWVAGAAISTPASADSSASFTLGVDHHPAIYIVDLDRWNGSTPQNFSNASDGGSLLLRVTNDCGANTANCIDASSAADLEHMVCPVTGEVSAYQGADTLQAVYWGDECGQLFKLWTDDDGQSYQARRLINLNGGTKEVSKDARKIFRKLDLVTSLCPGRPVTSVYFGTGNIQRPTAKDELQNAQMTNGRDIVGVLWDDGTLPDDLTDSNLMDVSQSSGTSAQEISAQGKLGWFFSLNANERMLRDPLVFDQIAYFKTYEPTVGAVECGGGSGNDRIYAVDSCNGDASTDVNGDGSRTISERNVWNGSTEIGGDLFFFTPKNSSVLVSHADISKKQDATLNPKKHNRPGLFLWREK